MRARADVERTRFYQQLFELVHRKRIYEHLVGSGSVAWSALAATQRKLVPSHALLFVHDCWGPQYLTTPRSKRGSVYFNQRFGVSAIEMRRLGTFNPKIGVDNRMFVDPKLLNIGREEFKGAHDELVTYFAKVVQLVRLIKTRTNADLAWTEACRRMRFRETTNTALGFSRESTNGNGIGRVLAQRIVTRASEILPQVNFEPEVFELIGVFAERVGCDRVSDMIVHILKHRFLAYTDRVTRALGVNSVIEVSSGPNKFVCPRFRKGDKPMILVPANLLKPLPIATDIEDALAVADLNEAARAEVNRIYAEAQKRRVSPKSHLRIEAIRNASITRGIISGYKKASPAPYDYDRDPSEVAKLDPIAREIVGEAPTNLTGLSPMDRVEKCMRETIDHVRKSIEQNRLSDLLYDDTGVPRNEVVSQRLIYAVAEIFAKMYDVDQSREGNAGPGAVDFRFTVGHQSRLLVEVKLSTHRRLKEGYYEQLPAYAKAENIQRMVLLLIRVSTDDAHLDGLVNAIRRKSLPIQVEVIDAVPKPSASKRPYTSAP